MKTTSLAILNTQQIVCLNGASTSHPLAGTNAAFASCLTGPNAAFASCFTGPDTQLMLPQHGLSGWTGMQDAHNALSCISLLLLGTSAGCSSTVHGSTLLSQPQPGKTAKGLLLTPAGLCSSESYQDRGIRGWSRKGRHFACPGKLFCLHL